MNSATVPTIAAFIIQSVLGLSVFQANPRRRANQCFLLLSIVVAGWLASLYFTFTASTAAVAEFYIRQASAAGAVVLLCFNWLRLTIVHPGLSWREILGRSRAWLFGTTAMVLFCQTKWFLVGATISSKVGATPEPLYARAGGLIYLVGFAVGALVLIVSAWRDWRKTAGGQHAEIGFVLIGAICTGIFPLFTVVLQRFIDSSLLIRFAPLRVLLFSIAVAYAISTRKIMEVGTLFRRVMSYVLLTVYLLCLYGMVWWLVATALHSSTDNAHAMAHVAAAVAIAFAMAPARGVSQRLAERLFISSQRLDFRATMNEAAAILKSVTTLGDLFERFAQTIARAVGTDRVVILMAQKEDYAQQYPPPTRESRIDLPKDHTLVAYLKSSAQPIVLDELYRIRSTPEIHRVIGQMRHLNLSLIMGIYARDQLEGVMILGPRLFGRIYGTAEQEALQVLCGQLAVAIENAELFTEVQNAKIYNETLLENLTTGVIAAGTDGRITVFNNEAGQITGLNAADIIDRYVEDLPAPLRDAFRVTLHTSQAQEDNGLVLNLNEHALVLHTSTSIFHGEDRKTLGALMVLTDITALKRLEQQIRRSDRLASLGTLSAGMAHEIKNPLVSIKTFAQLLPERYQDSDFRETFSNLIGHEIDRIDSLVNQLLRFARPAKPLLKPMHIHEILEKSLLLVGHRLYQKDIKLVRSFRAEVDTIRADPDQLEQVFLNFFINAMDAMKNGGELNISTEIQAGEEWVARLNQSNGDSHEFLRVTIRDSGEGIRREDLAHVFDPFFTTKDYGTGLGLSVVHGIIQEHGGQIEVESELAKGTAFHILLPLVHFDSEVAAA